MKEKILYKEEFFLLIYSAKILLINQFHNKRDASTNKSLLFNFFTRFNFLREINLKKMHFKLKTKVYFRG
jgi:hypothetical protein